MSILTTILTLLVGTVSLTGEVLIITFVFRKPFFLYLFVIKLRVVVIRFSVTLDPGLRLFSLINSSALRFFTPSIRASFNSGTSVMLISKYAVSPSILVM